MIVYSTYTGTSAGVLPQILRLYLPKGGMIADLTFGGGVFWRRVDRLRYTIIASDIERKPDIDFICDARKPAYRSNSFDCIVLDPPYGNGSTTTRTDGMEQRYGLDTLKGYKNIIQWYKTAIANSRRILNDAGVMIIKGQNMVDSGRQRPIKYLIWAAATRAGLQFLDEIDLVSPIKPKLRHPDARQLHARKDRSTFLVFGKEYYEKRKRLR